MVAQFPAVSAAGQAGTARDGLRALGEAGHGFTHIFVLGDAGEFVGQVSIVDLALTEDDTPIHTL